MDLRVDTQKDGYSGSVVVGRVSLSGLSTASWLWMVSPQITYMQFMKDEGLAKLEKAFAFFGPQKG
jgi:hypothetical protein